MNRTAANSHHPAFVTTFENGDAPFEKIASSGALAGLRLAVKDLFDIKGIPTGAGNPTWLETHSIPTQTHTSVTRLITAGAQYVGKTLTDELAYSLNGQNIHYPALLNPLTPERLIGGSSSGSAAAVAENMADIGLGTDTGGSIRVPASYNGLFGIRPTHGVIKCDNMFALAPSFDTVGWLTRDIETLEKVAHVLFPNTQDQKRQKVSFEFSSMEDVEKLPLKPTNLFLPTNLIQTIEHASEIKQWLDSMQNIDLTESVLDTKALQTSETFRILQGFEIWQQHGDWINQFQPKFAQDIGSRIEWCSGLTQNQYERAKKQQELIEEYISKIFKNQSVMIVPTTPGRAPLLSMSNADLAGYREELMALTAIAGLTGRPQIHLPLFTLSGAPCGLSLIGEKNADLQLISIAKELLQQADNNALVKN